MRCHVDSELDTSCVVRFVTLQFVLMCVVMVDEGGSFGSCAEMSFNYVTGMAHQTNLSSGHLARTHTFSHMLAQLSQICLTEA